MACLWGEFYCARSDAGGGATAGARPVAGGDADNAVADRFLSSVLGSWQSRLSRVVFF